MAFLVLLLASLLFLGGCQREDYPIPSFCAAVTDWGPHGTLAFNNTFDLIPPETPYPVDPRPAGLWTIRADGTEPRFLGSFWSPSWSPDGRWIAVNGIWLISPDGDSQVRITQKWGSEPSFSPDGRKLAFASDSDALGPSGIRILDLRTKAERFVFPYGTTPSWSPDGGRLVIHTGHSIVVIDTTGERVDTVYKARRGESTGSPSFSPDGRRIVFSAWPGGEDRPEVWVVNSDGSRPRRLKKGGRWPSWSPDGNKIVYTRFVLTLGFERGIPAKTGAPVPGNGDLFVIDPDGSGEQRLTYFYPR